MRRALFIAVLCGSAVVGPGCGDDGGETLSREETGREIGEICDRVEFDKLTGDLEEDARILKRAVAELRDGIQEIKDLEVPAELDPVRDDFAYNAFAHALVIEQAQKAADKGDSRAYRRALEDTEPHERASFALAAELGATACNE